MTATNDDARDPVDGEPFAGEITGGRDAEMPRIRHMRPDDLERETHFVDGLSEESRYKRLFSLRHLSPAELERLTHPDSTRERALVATVGTLEDERFVGVARYAVGDDPNECEFAIVVADEWQHHGIGHRLLSALIEEARAARIPRMFGYTFVTNRAMLDLAQSLGFARTRYPGDNTLIVMSKKL